jgi:mono/diheme cytochrome c family protein
VAVVFDGDPALGKRVSLLQCGRCHVVAPETRMGAIGSTPSFAVLRTFADWDARFQSFFALKPHAAFTQVAGVTAPFAIHLPSPIAPIEVTLEELEAIIAYVAGLAPADLGAPIQVQ